MVQSQPKSDSYLMDIPLDPELKAIFWRLKSGFSVDDQYFDRILPYWARKPSRVHWTPVMVARRAVELLTESRQKTKILDVGSGCGKFCLIAASVSHATLFGLEQRTHYVELSRKLAQHYRISNLTFIQANMKDVDWSWFNSIYLFNPFLENRLPNQKIDDSIELERQKYFEYVKTVESKLRGMPKGSRVVTYFGFGGCFPASYSQTVREFCGRGPLECWVKTQ
jgi:SAM-dependent methyltransferase